MKDNDVSTSSSVDPKVVKRVLVGFVLVLIVFVGMDGFLTSSSTRKFAYDRQGRLVSRTTPNGRMIKYTYDKAGLLVKVSHHQMGAITKLAYPASDSVNYEYDLAGNRVAMKDKLGRTQYAYDEYGRLSQVTAFDGKKLSYEYNPWNRVKQIVFPDGDRVQYRYDLSGNLTSVNDGKMGMVTYEYHGDSHQTVRKLPNGISTTYEYSVLGQLILIRHQQADGQPICAYHYDYDSEGRIGELVETTSKGAARWKYEYDLLGRLTKATQPDNSNVSYEYDAIGNRLSQTDSKGTTRYQYDDQGRLIRAGENAFVYDHAGNLVSQKDKTQSTTYKYDDENRLLEIKSGKNVTRYVYDGDGNRVRREFNGRVTTYLNETIMGIPQVVAEYGADGQMANYLLGRSRIGRRNANGDVVYFLEDHLGSTRYVVDSAGSVRSHYSFSAFGVPELTEGATENESSYTGEPWEADANLLYLRSRYYNPQLGRFLSPDPLPGEPTDPESFNGYAYVANDPVNQVDPLGLQGWPPPPFYNPMREPWRFNPPIPPVERISLTRQAPTPHSFSYYFGRELWTMTSRGQLFRATTPWQHDLRALLFVTGAGSSILLGNDLLQDLHERNLRSGSQSVLQETLPHGIEHGAFGMKPQPRLGQTLGRSFQAWDVYSELREGFVAPWLLSRTKGFLSERKERGSSGLYTSFDNNWFEQRRTIFLPPPGDGGGGFPMVGGVYLDQAARVIGQLGAIAGAVYDPTKGQLILIGDKNTTLPAMKPEYLAAAFRAVYAESRQQPGMTIDPNPQNPHGPLMNVIFFGNTGNTCLGWVMFEADRVMKGYSVGNDNITKLAVQSSVPGYQSVAAMSLRDGNVNSGLWSRFWLVPEPVTGTVSEDGRSIIFDPIRMRVKTETMRWEGGRLVSAGGIKDPEAEAFAEHFTQQYDNFARENPIYAELKQVAQAVALAKWLKQQNVAVDWNFVRLYATPYMTPDTTPAAHSELAERFADGMQTGIRKISSFGGVNMSLELQLQKSPETEKFHNEIMKEWNDSQKQGQLSFNFKVANRELSGIALPGVNEREIAGYSRTESEMSECLEVSAELAQLPGLARYYDSSHNESTEFGFSWSQLLPRLEFESAAQDGRTPYVSVAGDDSTSVMVQRFILTNQFGLGGERFVNHFVDQDMKRIGFAAERGRIYRGLYPEQDGSYLLIFNSGDQAVFDSKGRLATMLRPDIKAVYEYDQGNHLISISFLHGNKQEQVHFDYDLKGRIASIAADNARATYGYDEDGNLSSAGCRGRTTDYRYDKRRLLVRVSTDGELVAENTFDDMGRLLKQRDLTGNELEQKAETTAEGKLVTIKNGVSYSRRYYDSQQRLSLMESGDGTTSKYSYDDNGQLARVDESLPTGGKATIEVSLDRRTVTTGDPRGVLIVYRFNEHDQLAEISINNRRSIVYQYDEQNRLSAVTYEDGSSETVGYDAQGRVVEYRLHDSQGDTHAEMVSFVYNKEGKLTGIGYPATGQVTVVEEPGIVTLTQENTSFRYEYDSDRLVRVLGPAGSFVTYDYQQDGKLRGIQLSQAGIARQLEFTEKAIFARKSTGGHTSYFYAPNGLLSSVEDSYGRRTSYSYDNKSRLQRIELPNGRCREYLYDPATDGLREERATVCRK